MCVCVCVCNVTCVFDVRGYLESLLVNHSGSWEGGVGVSLGGKVT